MGRMDDVARCVLGLLVQYITYTMFCPKLRPFISLLHPLSLLSLHVRNLAAHFVYCDLDEVYETEGIN